MHGARGNGINSAFEWIRMLRARARLFAENWDVSWDFPIFMWYSRGAMILFVSVRVPRRVRARRLFLFA